MESRFRVLFLIVAVISLSGCAATKNLFGFGDREDPPPSSEPPAPASADQLRAAQSGPVIISVMVLPLMCRLASSVRQAEHSLGNDVQLYLI